MTVLFCVDCGMELDEGDVVCNLAVFGLFNCLCTTCIEGGAGQRDGRPMVGHRSVRSIPFSSLRREPT